MAVNMAVNGCQWLSNGCQIVWEVHGTGLRQAGGGLIQVHQLFGGKEAYVPVQPASPRPSQLMVELWCVLENFSGDLLMLRLSLQELSLLMLAS